MRRASIAVVAAVVAFVVAGLPAGVVGMVDPDYCVAHDEKPPATAFHDEVLSFFPPGPECRFTAADGSVTVVGPGWAPALVAALSVGAGLAAYRALGPR